MGCSGATTIYVAPNSVSGRVVNTRRNDGVPSTLKSTSAPVDLPIQLRCISFTPSGQSTCFKAIQQPFSIVRNAKHPLLQMFFLNKIPAFFMGAVIEHFFIGTNDPAMGAPPNLCLIIVSQAVLICIISDSFGALRSNLPGYFKLLKWDGLFVAYGQTRY